MTRESSVPGAVGEREELRAALERTVDSWHAYRATLTGKVDVMERLRLLDEHDDRVREATAVLAATPPPEPLEAAIRRICNVLDNDNDEGDAELYEAALELYRARLSPVARTEAET